LDCPEGDLVFFLLFFFASSVLALAAAFDALVAISFRCLALRGVEGSERSGRDRPTIEACRLA